MSVKQKAVYQCDHCEEEIKNSETRIHTHGVPNEGDSTIEYESFSYSVGDQDFCSIECFIDNLKKNLRL